MKPLQATFFIVAVFTAVLIASHPSYANREYLADPALQVRPDLDKLKFDHSEIEDVRGTNFRTAYWDIYGNYPSKVNLYKRRMKFKIDCHPENFPEEDRPRVSLMTIALGTIDNHMIKIIMIPPGAEEWMWWNEVSFITDEHIDKICRRK